MGVRHGTRGEPAATPPSRRGVVVVGAGTMGRGIAQLSAMHGHDVLLVDVAPAQRRRARESMARSLERFSEKGQLGEDPAAVLARIRIASDLAEAPAEAAAAGVGIEAVPEAPALKIRVLRALEAQLPSGAVLATNTSGIPLEQLAAGLGHPERFLAVHFFNPVVRQPVVEVVRGDLTDPASFEAALSFVRGLDREPLPVSRALPGFVLNRIAMVASNEAIRLVEAGIARAEDVDRGVRGAFGWKMGPLETADLVGLDVVLAARQQIYEATEDDRFRPPDLLRRLVSEGKLGRKTGEGFYRHPAPP